MNPSTMEFVNDVIEFSCQSMDWCAKESEKAAESVSDVLSVLMKDSERISKMSEETIKVLEQFKTQVSELAEAGKTSNLINGLKSLCKDNVEVGEMVYPIIETLQFQDQVTQNMANAVLMLKDWSVMRQDVVKSGVFDDAKRVEFGEKLLKSTTMAQEREIIRTFIDGLSEEEEVVDDVMMF